MLKTPLCDLLGIDVPVICAPFGPWHEVDLAAQARDASPERVIPLRPGDEGQQRNRAHAETQDWTDDVFHRPTPSRCGRSTTRHIDLDLCEGTSE
jgi:hypothetical protein